MPQTSVLLDTLDTKKTGNFERPVEAFYGFLLAIQHSFFTFWNRIFSVPIVSNDLPLQRILRPRYLNVLTLRILFPTLLYHDLVFFTFTIKPYSLNN